MFAQQSARLIEGWEFLKQDLGGVWEAVRPVKTGDPESLPFWEKVNLPHCFNATDAVDPDVNYYQGPGWYRNYLTISNPYPGGRTLLHFEGAGQKTQVYVYTTLVGSHVGGYDEFTVDITDAVKAFENTDVCKTQFKGKIPISIRCDNSRDLEMIPSSMSDFNVYGGIYRYLNLEYVPAFSIQRVFTNATIDAAGKEAKLSVSAKFNNKSELKSGMLDIKIFDPQGKLVTSTSKEITPDGSVQNIWDIAIKKPQLWSPSQPVLYACQVTLKSSSGEQSVSEKFGFRSFEFIKHGPFKLNGERLLLRGTHRHEDHAGVGQAMTEDMIRTEMKMMKDMGVNFIRLGHYQQSRIVLNLCDSLGIMVWEEIPWCRGGLGGDVYKEQARRMLTNMIEQHRNHPAIIIWGLGNENDWPGDFPEFSQEKIRAFMKEQNDLAHKLDATRKTAIRRCAFCKDIVDVYSPSIWAGWYRGQYVEYKDVSEKEMKSVDYFLHVEWGGDSHARRHSENPDRIIDNIPTGKGVDERAGDASLYGGGSRVSKDGDWSETYICNLIDWHLKEQETMPWLSGAAYWPFKDFSTPIRPENPVPYVNQKGVVERDFTKKESYYVFQSYWTEKPMIHIYGHSWPIRWGAAGESKMLKVYSNCPEAELFLNGKSYGVKKRNSQDFPAAGLRWTVKFNEGDNNVKVVAHKGKQVVEDEIKFQYQTATWGAPAKMVFEKIGQTGDTATIQVRLLDEKGVMCLDATNMVEFSLNGDGRLLDNLGTSTGSRKVQVYNGRAIIRVKTNNGRNIAGIKSQGMKTVFLEL
ncbi:MAG: glycoside hydrolase family 2 TIM barrel-domain containing protein [Bacteroidota bacterium]|nr:glycoside hydrolase family 2 TIM barrel-domain containing protein [Bacteroidota bacterium]